MKKLQNSRYLFALLAVVAGVIIGVGAWFVFKSDNAPANANTEAVRKALENANCDKQDDKNICKFFTSWKASRYFTAKTTTKVGRTTNTSSIKVDGQNYHAVINAELQQETIVIGKTLYTKDTQKNKWYKQELTKPGATGFKFDKSELQSAGGKFTYKQRGKEACGELTCFKYEVINAEDRGLKQYIWFDDRDYQLRKQSTEQKETFTTTETTFSYNKVTISEPSPFTELRKGEIYIPGQGVVDPTVLPGVNADDFNKLLEQFQQ